MSGFKIYEKPDDKRVIFKAKFSEINKYNDLKQKLIDATQSGKFKNFRLAERDKFVLTYILDKDQDKKPFIPDDLKDGFWDNKTFGYLKEKLSLRGIQNAQYKLYVKKVDQYPKWKKRENHEFLTKALNDSWKPIFEDIVDEVSLMKLETSKIEYLKKKEDLTNLEKGLNKEEHENVVCNNCFENNIKGKRFICAECNNYNLCQKCEKLFYQKQIHPREHILIQVNKAIKEEILYSYNNIIGNNNQEFKNVPFSFQLEFKVINNGEKDLKGCYILPIRYGEDYLSCAPKKITEEVKRTLSTTITLLIRVPHKKGYFEGYFRMFTPEGLPFGNVLCVKVLNGE